MDAEPVEIGRRLASRGQDPGPGKKDTTSETSPKGVHRSSDEGMNTEEIRRNTRDPSSWGGKAPTQAPRGDEAVRAGVGEVHSSKEPSNERGAKGPQFQGNVTSGKRAEMGVSLPPQIKLWELQRQRATSRGRKHEWTLVRKPRCGKSARPV